MRSSKFPALMICFCALSSAEAGSYRRLASELVKQCRQVSNPTIAIFPFSYVDRRESPGSLAVSERLTSEIASRKGLKVVERSLLGKMNEELKLRMSGVTVEGALAEIGKVLKVNIIVTGTIIDLPNGQVEINARAIRMPDGFILGVARTALEKDWQESALTKPPIPAADPPRPARVLAPALSSRRLSLSGELFRNRCAMCHGPDGKGDAAPLKSLETEPDDMDLTTPRVQSKTDEQLTGQIEEGGRRMSAWGNLPGFSERIPRPKVVGLISYVRALGLSARAEVLIESEESLLQSGAGMFRKGCAYCHGFNARGSRAAAKALGVKGSDLDLTVKDWSAMTPESLDALMDSGKGKMPPQPGALSKEEASALVHYFHRP